MSDPIRVVVVDDQDLVRSGFVALINATPGLAVVGEAADGEEAVAVALRARPDVVLMDIRMPKLDGIEATARILGPWQDRAEGGAAVFPGDATPADAIAPHDDVDLGPKVIVLTTFDLDTYVYRALRAGASGFLLKDVSTDDLLDAIRIVAAGDALLAPSITRRLIREFAARPDPAQPPPVLDVLTAREREVLVEVARGRTNAEIATDLFMSVATVKTHVSRTMAKLHCSSRAQLVVAAYEARLVVPGAG